MEKPIEIEGVKSFGEYVRNAWQRANSRRPLSFYLLLALFVMLPLGTRMISATHDPRTFAFFVTLHLVFLFVLLVQAIYDIAEIIKDHFKERERLYRATLGDADFARQLGQRVLERREDA